MSHMTEMLLEGKVVTHDNVNVMADLERGRWSHDSNASRRMVVRGCDKSQ